MIICLDQRTGNGCGAENLDSARNCIQCGMPLRFALLLHDPDTQIGDYRVLGLIGHGGFGAVYRAESLRDGRRVALKETFDPDSIASFQSEFQVLSALEHANLPAYDELFEFDGNGYMVMEYVPGQSLQDVLDSQSGPLPESQVLGYALQLCDVLHYLHRQPQPIIHRDIKPANIRLTPEGRIKLVDFGLLKQGGQQTRQTMRGIGTPAYAPIEQYGRAGPGTDPRSDIYSLGATLYHLLTGEEPLPATDRIATTPDPLTPPRAVNPALSPHIEAALLAALALTQTNRPPSVLAFRQALLGGTPAAPERRSVPAPQPASPKQRAAPVFPPDPPKPREYILVQYLRGHSAAITSVAFSPDNRLIASASDDKTVRLWNLEQEAIERVLSGHQDSVWSVAFNPDGQTLASASADSTVRLWNVGDGRVTGRFFEHVSRVITVAFSPDGTLAASAGWDSIVYLWDAADGRMIDFYEGHKGHIYSVAFSPDGQTLASSGMDRTIRLWSVDHGNALAVLEGHTDDVSSIAFHPDGNTLLSVSDDQTLRVWRLRDKRTLRTLHEDVEDVRCVAFSPDGRTFATGELRGRVRLWNARSYQIIEQLASTGRRIWSLAYSPDSTLLAAGGDERVVRVWHVG